MTYQISTTLAPTLVDGWLDASGQDIEMWTYPDGTVELRTLDDMPARMTASTWRRVLAAVPD